MQQKHIDLEKLPNDILKFQSWGNSVTQQLTTLVYQNKAEAESLLKENTTKFVADFRKLALKYHPDKISDVEQKALYTSYFQALSNIRDQIQQDWEQAFKDELVDGDLEEIRNQFAELKKDFEKLWQTLKEISEQHKEIHQLQDQIAEQHRKIAEDQQEIKELQQQLAESYREDIKNLKAINKSIEEYLLKIEQTKQQIAEENQKIAQFQQKVMEKQQKIAQIVTSMENDMYEQEKLNKELSKEYKLIRQDFQKMAETAEKTATVLLKIKEDKHFFKSLQRQERLDALSFDKKLQQETVEWFEFMDNIKPKIKQLKNDYAEISEQNKENEDQLRTLLKQQETMKSEVAELEQRLYALECRSNTRLGKREVRRTLADMKVVEWEPLDTSAKIDILKEILNYLEKFVSEVKACFDVKVTPFFKSIWNNPAENVVIQPAADKKPAIPTEQFGLKN